MRWFRWVWICVLLFVLVGCKSNVSEGDAEAGIRALLEGNFEEAGDHICEAEIERTRATTENETFSELNYEVECQRVGDQMLCEITLVDPGQQEGAMLELRYELQDGKLCDRTQ